MFTCSCIIWWHRSKLELFFVFCFSVFWWVLYDGEGTVYIKRYMTGDSLKRHHWRWAIASGVPKLVSRYIAGFLCVFTCYIHYVGLHCDLIVFHSYLPFYKMFKYCVYTYSNFSIFKSICNRHQVFWWILVVYVSFLQFLLSSTCLEIV